MWKGRLCIIGGMKPTKEVDSEHRICRHMNIGTERCSSCGSRGVCIRRITSSRETLASGRSRSGILAEMLDENQEMRGASFHKASEREA